MRILIADDHSLFRAGLKTLLTLEIEGVEIVGEASDGLDAVSMTEKMNPDIVLMDISMPLLNGLEATIRIKKNAPQVKVIILSQHMDIIYVNQAMSAGASGYVNKDAVFDEIRVALGAAQKDQIYLTPGVVKPIVNTYLQVTPEQGAALSLKKLTTRERDVFHLLAKGCNRLEIGECLKIKPKTVDTHRLNLLKKLNISDGEIADIAKLILP